MVGVGLAMFVEKAGLGPADGVRIQVDTSGEIEVITGGASIGQGFETVMAQVAAEMLGADMNEDARHPRPDRPHRARHRRACLARHGDDGVGDARRRAEGARQGAGHRVRADAGAGRHARHRQRRGGGQRPRRRPVDDARPDRRGARRRAQRRAATASPGSPPKAGSTPTTRSIPTAIISPW